MPADPVVSPADTPEAALANVIRAALRLPSPAYKDELEHWAEAQMQAEVALDALLAVGERDKAELARLRATEGRDGCPAGDECAINAGAVHCFHCRRNWPRDETWEQPFLNRPDLRNRKIETMHAHIAGLTDALELLRDSDSGERDRQQIARLTEALEEVEAILDLLPAALSPKVAETTEHLLVKARRTVDAVLADEEDAGHG